MKFARKLKKMAFAIMTVKSEADMDYPRMTNDPYTDADAMDRYRQEQQDGYNKIRCSRCHQYVEDGDRYLKYDGKVLCEYCIDAITTVMVY